MYDLKTLIAALIQTKRPNLFLWTLLMGSVETHKTRPLAISKLDTLFIIIFPWLYIIQTIPCFK